ncbi:MAG: phosphoribosylaminoimidazolesuccinocarboxamide synthase [Candidatus Nealsonbacteria bacterium]
MDKILVNTAELFPELKWQSGKVRDWTDVYLDYRLVVSTDRISAFDEALATGIECKGRMLNQISVFWINFFQEQFPEIQNDLASYNDESCLAYLGVTPQETKEILRGRMVLVRKANVVPVECVVRGYLSGSGWESYRQKGEVCGIKLPSGLKESEELPWTIFTPTTKAPQGKHDTPLDFDGMQEHIEFWAVANDDAKKVVADPWLLAEKMRSTSLDLYIAAKEYVLKKGIIIADTKFEFGFIGGQLCLIDEVLTPDSSRFWDKSDYQPGRRQKSFDKQPVRDWFERLDRKGKSSVSVPLEVAQATTERYKEAYRRLTGNSID